MKVPIGTASCEIEVRRSRFIAFAGPCEDGESVRSKVAETRAAHAGCNHVVWAFVVGKEGERFGSNDDHEPKGTAGRPALEVLRGSEITNVLVQIVRFFGGTKLGTGGLARAYAGAAREVLALLKTEPLVSRVRFSVELDYGVYDRFLILAHDCEAILEETNFETAVSIHGRVEESAAERLSQAVRDLTSGTARLRYDET